MTVNLEQPAVFSTDRQYRFLLRRNLGLDPTGEGRTITYLMLNPSTADEEVNDATIRRCIGFGRAWNYAQMYVVNLSPYRATEPQDLKARGPEPPEVWQENLVYVLAAAQRADTLVAAYGSGGQWEDRAARVLRELDGAGVPVWCFGVTRNHYPLHPVRLPKIATLHRYDPKGNPWENLTSKATGG